MDEPPETFIHEAPASQLLGSAADRLRGEGISEDEIADAVGEEMLNIVGERREKPNESPPPETDTDAS